MWINEIFNLILTQKKFIIKQGGGAVKLLSEALTIDLLLEQCDKLKRKNFHPGFDRMTADAAKIWIQVNGNRLLRDIADGRFSPMPAIGFSVAKMNGGYRRLCRLTAIDSLIQLCLLPALNEIGEAFFSASSYAYRAERGLGAALRQFCAYSEEYAYAAKLDPRGCYDHIDHDLLKKRIADFLPLDSSFENLLDQYMKMPVWTENRMENRTTGLLQGAPISPFLCNLYFHPLDLYLEGKGIPFIRYADDLVLFANSSNDIQARYSLAATFLTNELKLTVHQQKSKIGPSIDMKYLGHSFTRDRRGTIALKADDSSEGAYYSWYQEQKRNTHRTMDILSDGVLRQKDYSLFFETEAQDSSIPLLSIDMINIYSSVVFDSGFLQRALETKYISICLTGMERSLAGFCQTPL